MKHSLLAALTLFLLSTSTSLAQLDVLAPDGGEQLVAGSIISIVWGGVPSSTPVDISFTLDDGITWESIAVGVTGHRYLWEVPALQRGATCLLRVSYEGLESDTPELIRTFRGHDKTANTVDISSDNQHMVSGGADGKVVLWDLGSTRPLWSQMGHTGPIIIARFSNSGRLVATASMDGSAKVWNVETGALLHTFTAGRGIVWPVDFSANDKVVASGNDDGSISWWNLETGQNIQTIKVHREAVRYLEYSRDGEEIYAASTDGSASIVDAESGAVLETYDHADGSGSPIVNGIQASSNGRQVITIGYDGWTRFWNRANGELVRSAKLHEGREVSEIRLSPDETMIASAGYNSIARILNITPAGDVLYSFDTKSGGNIRTAFTPDGSYVAFSHFNGSVTLWELPAGEVAESDDEWRIEVCESALTGVEEAEADDVNTLELW